VAKTKPAWIYHITHVDNLASIIEDGCLWSDRRLVDTRGERVVIGMNNIKRRRIERLPVHCHRGTRVGDYVPFYFCQRSPMLYMIHKRNADLTYRDGQDRVVHLVSTTDLAIQAAADRPWAFSDGNAGAYYTQFSADINQLPTFVDWNAVNARWWRGPNIDPAVMSKKMAEFLVHDRFPWTSIGAIGAIQQSIADEVQQILADADHKPQVAVKRDWYY